MNDMVGSYYSGMPSIEHTEAAAEGGKPEAVVSAVSSSVEPQRPPVQNGRFQCQQCGMSFATKSAHTSHARSHGRPPGGSATTPQQAASPTSAGGGGGGDPYRCDVCRKTFAVPARLVRHYRTHTGERPFECEFCHKMFSVKENLQVHRRIHTKERPYRCQVCGRAFEHSGKLHRHMRIHTGERPHACTVCKKTFIQSGQLVIHLRTHTGEKPYRCSAPGCGKGFTCSKQLKVHSRTHTGEKPYHCDICFRDFGYNHVLKLHRVQHYGAKCYKCTICDDTFKSKKEMESHIKGHADDLVEPMRNEEATVRDVQLENVMLIGNNTEMSSVQLSSGLNDITVNGNSEVFTYDQLALMRQRGYFGPQPVPEFKPILEPGSNIVRCVEAALAGAEDAVSEDAVSVLTPPSSTPERSSSPEDPLDLVSHREMLSLPLRKRKMYMKPIETAPIRMNSVIQFARAS